MHLCPFGCAGGGFFPVLLVCQLMKSVFFFARYMPVISSCIALGMLWIVGKWKLVIKGLVPALLTGLTAGFIAIGMNYAGLITITGIAAGLGVVLVNLVYLKIIKQPVFDRRFLSQKDLDAEKQISLGRAISPWLILTFFSLIVNAPFLPFFELTFTKLAIAG